MKGHLGKLLRFNRSHQTHNIVLTKNLEKMDDLLSAPFGDLLFDVTDMPTQDPIAVSVRETDVIVFVSSRTFSIQPYLFQQVKGLPWRESGGYSHLDADPNLFEVILTFYIAGWFPGRVLIKEKKDEILELVSHLGEDATELKACIAQGGGGRKTKTFTRSNSKKMSRRSSNGSAESLGSIGSIVSAASTKKILKSTFKPKKAAAGDDIELSTIADLVNAPLSDDMSDLGSDNGKSTLSNNSERGNPTANVEGKEKQRRWNLGPRQDRKKLHQELCESEYIV